MDSVWDEITLGELSEDSAFGPRFSSDLYSESGNVATLRTTDISPDGRIEYEEMPLADLDLSKMDRHVLRRGDLVITRTGRVGTTALFTDFRLPVLPGAFLIRFRLKTEHADPLFYRYFFNSREGQALIKSVATGSVQQNLNITNLHTLQLPLPPLGEQRAIAGVLGALDDKIEQNRRTAGVLERLARAIFRAWFIDFLPVRAKSQTGRGGAAGETSFPGMPQHVFDTLATEFTSGGKLGPIPQGWEVKAVGDVCDVNARSIRKGEREGEIEYVNIASVTRGHLDEVEQMDFADAPSRARRLIQDGDTIWSCVRPNRMSYLYIHDPPESRIVSTGFAVLTPKSIGPSFLYQLTTQPEFVDYLVANATGSAYPAIRGDHFETAHFCCPPPSMLDAFEKMTHPMRRWIGEAERESRKLAELRDYLLPKLLSGAVRVREAEKVVEGVV